MGRPSPSSSLSVAILLSLAASSSAYHGGLVFAPVAATPPQPRRCDVAYVSAGLRRRRHRCLGGAGGIMATTPADDDGDRRDHPGRSSSGARTVLSFSRRQMTTEDGPASREREEGGGEEEEEETTTTTPTRRGRYFDLDSTVRSTTGTGAISRAARGGEDNDESSDDDADGDGGMIIPPEVLRPFTLLLLSQFVLFLGVGAVIPTIPLYGQSIGLSSASNGVVIGAPALALLLVSRAAGEYADSPRGRGGRRRAMMGGMAVIAIADLGTAYSSDLGSLVLARLGLGLGRGYAEAGERGMLADLANGAPGLRGRALALQQACVALGIAIGAPLGGIVVQEYGPRSAFLCVSAAAVVALIIYGVLPETVGSDDNIIEDDKDEDEKDVEDGDDDDGGGELWRRLLKTSSTWRSLALAQSGASFGYACKIAIVPILADEYLGGPAGAGLLLSAAGLAGLVGAPLGGLLADRAGSRVAAAAFGMMGGSSLALVPVGLSLTKMMDSTMASVDGGGGRPSSSLLVEGLSSDPSWIDPVLAQSESPEAFAFVLLVLLWSVGATAQGPALTALAQEKAPAGSEATALGLPRAIGDGTYIVAPLIMGYFCDIMGDAVPGIACTIAGGAIVLGSIALLTVDPADDDAVGVNDNLTPA